MWVGVGVCLSVSAVRKVSVMRTDRVKYLEYAAPAFLSTNSKSMLAKCPCSMLTCPPWVSRALYMNMRAKWNTKIIADNRTQRSTWLEFKWTFVIQRDGANERHRKKRLKKNRVGER